MEKSDVWYICKKSIPLHPHWEGCRSGRSGRTRNAVNGQLFRGFESLLFRRVYDNGKQRGCVKTLAQPFSIIYSPVIFSFVYAAFFSFIW